ncbi:hypothetical protein [Alteribacter keqinensis]|uniref:ZIP Zinc transporter n=1 Tax=Alteribacter keqinensis TaxID=2483800 RepID=A0A3M7TLD8_9BACI|nr:hypothetical protein [Alteribacter keqinensis]RNA66281.1 hypothetical protein EBO34_19360 [Alteribacter keqinensis]
MIYLVSFLCVAGFIVVHLFSRNVTFLHTIPRSKVLSVAGGVSIAYVFMHILPELHMYQDELHTSEFHLFGLGDYHVYLASLLGLSAFYGLERMAKGTIEKGKRGEDENPWVFRTHILSFFFYNFLIGYLLLRGENRDPTELFLYFFALSVHFVSNDHALRQTHKEEYDVYGRYLLAGAVAAGWLTGIFVEVSEHGVALLFSILAGTMILNVLKEELPEERESNFWAFGVGVLLYTILLYVI